MVELICPKIWS